MSKKKSSLHIPAVDGKHDMTSLELSEADDLATLMTVDTVLGFTTHKMDKNFNPSIYDKKLRERWKEIMEEFIFEHNYEQTYHQLVFTDKIKAQWKKDERFKRHVFRFLYLFDKRSGIEVRPCYRYQNEAKCGAAIFATREWERGSQISTLFGCISEVRQSEEDFFHETKNEFSVMYSTRKNCSQLWLGPAAYVNHDCKPNCRFTEANYDSKMTLETLRDIHPNEELLIYYGNNFFGMDNAECECFTCELQGRGLFNYSNMQRSLNNIMVLPHYMDNYPTRNNSNSEFSDSNQRVLTRSSKMLDGLNYGDENIGAKMISAHSLQGALNGLKQSNNSYSLRITYSRIDRAKQSILSKNAVSVSSSQGNHSNAISKNLTVKSKRKKKLTLSPKNKNIGKLETKKEIEIHKQSKYHESKAVSQRTLRQTNRKNHSLKSSMESHVNLPLPLEESSIGKLTLKLRKTADHPNQYEHCAPVVSKPQIQKLTINTNSRSSDSNIFSRITELYLSHSENITPTPRSDTPPFLSPWFCSDKYSNSHSSQKSKNETSKTKIKLKTKSSKCAVKSNRLKIINLNTKPKIKNCYDNFDFCLNVPETSNSSDIPSYSASTPTIPILEIESEIDLVPIPPPPQLDFEQQDRPASPFRNKGIVMKFSRICGNRFISLLS